jgi:ComF family protein
LPFTDFFNIQYNKTELIFKGRMDVTAASLLYFEAKIVQPMMHALKYQSQTNIAELLGELIAEKMQNSQRFNHIDLIVPVPLHPKKEKLRGFNQSWVVAKAISNATGIKAKKNILERTQHTSTQTQKNRSERWQNVSTAFRVKDKQSVAHKNILLVDDVITTGATAEACLQECKKNGAGNLYFVSAAIA